MMKTVFDLFEHVDLPTLGSADTVRQRPMWFVIRDSDVDMKTYENVIRDVRMLGYKTSRIRPPSESRHLREPHWFCSSRHPTARSKAEKRSFPRRKPKKSTTNSTKHGTDMGKITEPRWLIYTDVPQPSRPSNRTHIRTHFYQASPSLMDPYVPQLCWRPRYHLTFRVRGVKIIGTNNLKRNNFYTH